MMKRWMFRLITMTVLLLGLTISASAATTTEDGFVLEEDSYCGLTVTGYVGPGGNITVPDGVKRIDYSAFEGNLKIHNVTLPD